MRSHVVAVAAAVLLVPPSIGAAQARAAREVPERSPDLGRADRAARAAAARDAAVAAARLTGQATTTGGLAATGDADSFGRSMKFLGVSQTLPVELLADCSGTSPDTERCVTPSPTSPTRVSFADLGRIDLPARAANSVICFTLTPYMSFEFWNGTGVPQQGASFSARAQITIENPVLADPALVDPSTGAPYGGRIVFVLGTYSESRSLAADEYAFKQLSLSRACTGGLISRSALVEGYGFNATQASAFFQQPMTFRFGSSIDANLVDYANYFYGLRLYGD